MINYLSKVMELWLIKANNWLQRFKLSVMLRQRMEIVMEQQGVRKEDRRFRDPAKGRIYEIKKLWALHHEILRRKILGQTNREIAKDLNITEPVVSYTTNSALGKRHLELMQGAVDKEVVDIKAKIKEMAAEATKVLEAALASDQPMALRVKAATDILDRAGFPKVTRNENLNAYLTPDDIESIKKRAREEGLTVEAEITEVKADGN
jgi:hypothetical protein